MDKLYFYGGDTGVSRPLRGLYSALTSVVIAYRHGDAEKSAVEQALQAVLTELPPLDEPRALSSLIEQQLQSCCSYWEEPERFRYCWPTIRDLLKTQSAAK